MIMFIQIAHCLSPYASVLYVHTVCSISLVTFYRCPAATVRHTQGNVKEPQYDVDFFKSFDLVMNGLDNLEARRHVNRLCLAAETPLIESGTAGYLGQVRLPHQQFGQLGSQQSVMQVDASYASLICLMDSYMLCWPKTQLTLCSLEFPGLVLRKPASQPCFHISKQRTPPEVAAV